MAINKPTVGQLGRMVESLKTDVQNTNRYISDIWRVIKLTNDNADALKKRIDALEQRKPVEVSVKADEKSLTAYVHQLEAFINDIEKELSNRLDVHRVDIDALEHRDDGLEDLIYRTANSIHAEIKKLEQRIGIDKSEPVPQRDTSWHPYDPTINPPPKGDERVVVMLRGSDEIQPMQRADEWNWGEYGCNTIIAWRYAKDGE